MQNDLTHTDDIEALRRLALEAWQKAEALQQQADALAHEKAQLASQTQALQSKNQLLTVKVQTLEAELSLLLQKISSLTSRLALATKKDEQQLLEFELERLRQQLAQHATEAYGASSERRHKDNDKTAESDHKKKQTGHGPTQQPKLPIVPVLHTLDEPDCCCPKCGAALREMKDQFESSQLIVAVERTYLITDNRRQKYHCTDCEHIETALGPTRLIPGGRYDLSFAVQVALDKYLDALPLERQVRRMGRAGLTVTSQTLFDQLLALYDVLLPTYVALKKCVLSAALLFADETPWRMMGRSASKKWWLWTLTSHNAVYFELFPTRGNAAARVLLENYAGIVMADGYAVYSSLAELLTKQGGAQVGIDGQPEVLTDYVLAMCWMHARRPFFKAEKNTPAATRALDLIDELYAIEKQAKVASAGDEAALLSHRKRLREERSAAVIAKLDLWRRSQRAMPKTKFHDGLQFLENHWTELTRFLKDARIPLDNGEAERQIRGPVVGRKNYYGNRSEEGARVAGLFYSLIGTAIKLGLEPCAYLTTAALRALNNPGTVTLPQDYKAELDARS